MMSNPPHQRPDTPNALLVTLGPAALGPKGETERQAFADIVRDAERWHFLFFERGPHFMPPDTFADIIALPTALSAQFDCALLTSALDGLRRRGPAAVEQLAAAAWRLCP